MVQFSRDKDDGIRGRVIHVDKDKGVVRVIRGDGDEPVPLILTKCLQPVKFENGIVYYDDSKCAETVVANDPIRIFADGHWVREYDLDHAPKVQV